MALAVCEKCGQTFRNRHGNRPVRFCGWECRQAAGQRTRTCPRCGKDFSLKASRPDVYCSVTCAGGRPRDPANYVTTQCPGCGKDVTSPVYRHRLWCSKECQANTTKVWATCPGCDERFWYYRSWPRVHCSATCYGRARDKGGRIYYGPDWVKQKTKAVARDRSRCVDCGMTQQEHGDALHVHHIKSARLFDSTKEANELGNLVTVCRTCHVARHGGRY